MKQFIEFIPLVLFFIIWKITPHTIQIVGYPYELGGIFSATQVLMLSSIVTYSITYAIQKKLERAQWITLVAVLLFGSFTLLFHEEAILKWKAPIVHWIFAAIYLSGQLFSNKTISQRLMGDIFEMPSSVWMKLDWSWIGYFILAGFIHLYVAFAYPTHWVTFKVFGGFGLTVFFLIAQIIILRKYLKLEESTKG